MNKPKVSIIITSWKEPITIKRVLASILDPQVNGDSLTDEREMAEQSKDGIRPVRGGLNKNYEILVVTPDKETWKAAQTEASKWQFKNIRLVQDKAEGKPKALNMAFKKAQGSIFILTDGDTDGLNKDAVRALTKALEDKRVGAVGGRPISADNRDTQFGFYSHIHCEAAHKYRLKQVKNKQYFPMSGYLYAIRNLKLEIPQIALAEDAWISNFLYSKGYKLVYEPTAEVYVHFPKNLNDWFKQKTRSLGGNLQLKRLLNEKKSVGRNLAQDFSMALFPITFSRSIRELFWAKLLYPLRLWLWVKVFIKQRIKKEDLTGKAWARTESSKY